MADYNSSDELKRLEALYSYHILDTDTEKDFDELTALAAAICDTPISLISFVDRDRQWFKSHYGLDARQTDRCHSFCSHAIQDPGQLMQIEDARNDFRFQDNPLVTGNPDIRFYAGIPLMDKEGFALGSLCVIDQKPKLLTEVQKKALHTIASQVIDKLLLRRNNRSLFLANKNLTETNEKLRIAEESLKKAVSDLTDSKEKIQNILDIVGEGIGLTDHQGNIVYTNKRNQEIFQMDEKSMLALSNISPEWNNRRSDGSSLPTEEHPITIALNTGNPVLDHILMITDQRGDSKYLRMNAMPVKDADGNVTGAIGSFADITESYLLQQKLKESEESLKSAISSANLGTWQMSVQTKELLSSSRTKELYGFYPDEPMPFDVAANQIAESHRQEVINIIESSILNDEPYEFEYPVVGYHDKKLRWVCATLQSYRDPRDLKTSYLSGTIADITERKLDEQRRTDFVGMVSHELRNPLTAIKAYVHLFNKRAKKNNDTILSDNLLKLDSQVKRMENLINGFLDSARLGEGKINLEKSHFDVAHLIRSTEEESLETITSHHLVFEPSEKVVVEADRNKIEQVLVNFINNAVKYSPRETAVTIKSFTQDGFLHISVKDNGMGIPEKDQPFIFDRFYRVESDAMKNKKGFGIGLYICKEIIERHNGQIGMESREGEGSTFWFKLPIAAAKTV
ncbi:hypothetical protein ASG31_07080 [Chryseobacterium sp. Leaf404]|uniref:ATP-binding protein n=1 Tax=unclassified Chryseobacterium TaxID=2593645 RepID=UPI0006FA21FC|nr:MULTISPECIES: ATP-binding protein [unclassified Chryseobacterium]KQT18476.1 hypothetical protein ASG31_07080 [Chryseobacterium sp. Leaf404]